MLNHKIRKFGKWMVRQMVWLIILSLLVNVFGAFVAPIRARAADPNMMLFWDGGGVAPTGWSYVDDGAGEAFYNDGVKNLFPRGNSSFGRMAGGADTHTHTATPTSPSGTASGGTNSKTGTVAAGSSLPTHNHAVSGSASLTTTSNLPAYRNLRVIQYPGIPTTIPSGAIAVFDAAAMPNGDWDSYSGTQGTNYVAALSTAGGLGGNNSHAGAGHTVSGLNLDTETQRSTPSGSSSGIVLNHTHIACSTNNTSNAPTTEPPYVNVLLGKTNKDTSVPAGMVAMFDANPAGPSYGWEVLSNVGGTFYQKFLKSAASYSAGAGTDPTHTHTSVSCTSDAKSSTGAYGTGSNNYGYRNSHTHTTTVTVNAATGSTLPPYTDVIFARKSYIYTTLTTDKGSYPTSGETVTLNSQVDNTSASALSNTKIDYVFFIDGNANNAPDAGETYVYKTSSECDSSGAWASGNYTFQTTGVNVAAGGNATDTKNCTNTNFPSNTTYVLWSKWYDNGGTVIYDTKYVTFTSVPTLSEILFASLVAGGVYLAVKTGAIKLRPTSPNGTPGFPAGDGGPVNKLGVFLSRSKQQRKNLIVKTKLMSKENQSDNNGKNI